MSHTDDTRSVNYDRNTFIIQATGHASTKKKYIFIHVEGVTLVLPSHLSCLTNIRENISYKLEYQLCETRSIRTSTSITLKETEGKAFSPFTSTKSHLTHTRNLPLCLKAQACDEHSILTLATFTGIRETSLALKVPKSFGLLEGPKGTPQKP